MSLFIPKAYAGHHPAPAGNAGTVVEPDPAPPSPTAEQPTGANTFQIVAVVGIVLAAVCIWKNSRKK